jgi:hypothetical protein
MSPPSSGNRGFIRPPCKAKLWRGKRRPPAGDFGPPAPPGAKAAGLPGDQPRWRGGGEGDDPGPSGFRNRSLSGLNCSASSASLVQVHAMSVRMERTLRFGARSAICRHSTARCLHSTGVIIDTQPNAPTDQEVAGRHYTTTATGLLTWTAVGMKKFDSHESDT